MPEEDLLAWLRANWRQTGRRTKVLCRGLFTVNGRRQLLIWNPRQVAKEINAKGK